MLPSSTAACTAADCSTPFVFRYASSRTRFPRIPGLEEVDVLHAGNWFERPERPDHLLVLGSREFSSLVNEVPTVAVRMMRGLAERLRGAERRQPQH